MLVIRRALDPVSRPELKISSRKERGNTETVSCDIWTKAGTGIRGSETGPGLSLANTEKSALSLARDSPGPPDNISLYSYSYLVCAG